MPLPHYKVYAITLALGVPQTLNVSGRFVRCLLSSERFEIALNGGTPVPMEAGLAFVGLEEEVRTIQLTSRSGATVASNAIELAIGQSGFDDSRLFLTSGSAIRPQSAATLDGSLADVTLVAATNTLLAAANSARRCIRVCNTGSADARVSSATADLTAGRGELVRPGETREFFVTGAIYARSTGTPTLNLGQELF